jgi:hypothetical protein
VLAELRELEPIFHRPQYFASRGALAQLLSPQFWEIGASGRRYSRAYVLRTLEQRAAARAEDSWQTSDFHYQALAAGVFLLTYTLRQGQRVTRRTTLWQRRARGWRILFHQGTVIGEP